MRPITKIEFIIGAALIPTFVGAFITLDLFWWSYTGEGRAAWLFATLIFGVFGFGGWQIIQEEKQMRAARDARKERAKK